jgi:hypothetical protein
VVEYNDKQRERIKENVHLLLNETKFRFNNQKEAWNDLDKKVFFLLGFLSLFVSFIIVDNLLDIFSKAESHFFKICLILGLVCIYIAAYRCVKIIVPTEFKISASVKDLHREMNKNKLFNAKFDLISAYEKMNEDNKNIINRRALLFKSCLYYTLLGLILIIISKSQSLILFLMEV